MGVQVPLPAPSLMQLTDLKRCTTCKEFKLVSEYPLNRNNHHGYDHRCRSCIKTRANIVKELRKAAPDQPKHCECCRKLIDKDIAKEYGKRHLSLCLDHDPRTNEFRGWICRDCNIAIGFLGDSLEGIMRAVNYLRLYEEIKCEELSHADQDGTE